MSSHAYRKLKAYAVAAEQLTVGRSLCLSPDDVVRQQANLGQA